MCHYIGLLHGLLVKPFPTMSSSSSLTPSGYCRYRAKLISHSPRETEKFNSIGHSFMLFSLVESCTGSGKGTALCNKSREWIEIIGEAPGSRNQPLSCPPVHYCNTNLEQKLTHVQLEMLKKKERNKQRKKERSYCTVAAMYPFHLKLQWQDLFW